MLLDCGDTVKVTLIVLNFNKVKSKNELTFKSNTNLGKLPIPNQ